ncbi:MAG: hypothetical protein IPH33_14570 [Bacteroidetes bacterium]|nr:hypothetical protein [Bacteroidota bacterium]HQU96389.1 hypothetical protein [Saprospiraceae bacterium]HQW95005.1 hypothetical protein [Saprospiraceae bacterium]
MQIKILLLKLKYLLILFLLKSTLGNAQNIYMIGNLRKTDVIKVKFLMSAISGNFEPRKIQLYSNSTLFYTYKNNEDNILTNGGLDSALNYLTILHSTNPLFTPSAKEIQIEKERILSKNSGRSLWTYDKSDLPKSPGIHNDFNTLQNDLANRDYINHKIVVLLVLAKEKPEVKINYPEDNQIVSSKIVEGVSNSIDSVTQVFVRVNKNNWFKATGTNNWKVELPLETSLNTIEAISIDIYNDTSITKSITGVVYKEKTPAEVSYISPNKSKNVVAKCIRSNGYCYNFKLSVDSLIDVKNLSIVVEDKDTIEITRVGISTLPLDAILKISGFNNYCFFTAYSITGSHNVCLINVEDDYYFRIIYNGEEKVKLPERIKVHFSSFNTESDQHEPCNCE